MGHHHFLPIMGFRERFASPNIIPPIDLHRIAGLVELIYGEKHPGPAMISDEIDIVKI
jgi:hypothetical protein